ncbi:hypothetical protein HJFPF1_11272 [Paramyrothecium foliicola]|nr:hypothetical protein HJFPF1_11272 [Paramyrothecium foliicola]
MSGNRGLGDAASGPSTRDHAASRKGQGSLKNIEDKTRLPPAVANALEAINAAEDNVGLKLRQQLASQHIISYIEKSIHFNVPWHDDCLRQVYDWTDHRLFQRVGDLESAHRRALDENDQMRARLSELEHKCRLLETRNHEPVDADPQPDANTYQSLSGSEGTIMFEDSQHTPKVNQPGLDDDTSVLDEQSLLSSFEIETPHTTTERASHSISSGTPGLLNAQQDSLSCDDEEYMEFLRNPNDLFLGSPPKPSGNGEPAAVANTGFHEHYDRPNKDFEDRLLAACEGSAQTVSDMKSLMERQAETKDMQFAELASVLEDIKSIMQKSLREAQISTFLAAEKSQYESPCEAQAIMTELLASRAYDEDGNVLN